MRPIRDLRHWYSAIVVLLVLGGLAIGRLPVHAQSGSSTSSAVPSDATPGIGQQIEVTIGIDVSGINPPDDALGSFTGSLDWSPAVLAYDSNSGILAGFTGVVNDSGVSSGHIAFNGALPTGAKGDITVLRITFDVIGAGTSTLDLGYSALAAAGTFKNLLPLLTVHDGHVQVQGTPVQYTLTVAVDPAGGGTTNPAVGAHVYASGRVVEVTAAPAAGYAFNHWSGACSGTSACQVTMDGDRSVTAHFTEVIYYELAMAVDPAGGGTTNPAVGAHVYASGTVVDVTAAPAAGYAFNHWSGACNGTSACQVTMDGDRAVTAHFTEVIYYELTISVDPAEGGTTDPEVGKHSHPQGTVVDIVAMPGAEYEFERWRGACSGSGPCQVTMDADKAVTAQFTELPMACYSLKLSHTGQGSDPVADPGNSTGCPPGRYIEGQMINLSGAQPDAGWYIGGWTGTSMDESTASTNSLTMPAAAHAASTIYMNRIYLPVILGSVTSGEPNLSQAIIEETEAAASGTNASTADESTRPPTTSTQQVAGEQGLMADAEHPDGASLTSRATDSPSHRSSSMSGQRAWMLPLLFILVVLTLLALAALLVSTFQLIKHGLVGGE